jgi:hypothetical protein
MVFRFTASEALLQAVNERATGISEATKSNDVGRDTIEKELRRGRDLRRHATRINAPKAGNSKARKCRTTAKVAEGKKVTGDSFQRLSKSPYQCKLKRDEKLPW